MKLLSNLFSGRKFIFFVFLFFCLFGFFLPKISLALTAGDALDIGAQVLSGGATGLGGALQGANSVTPGSSSGGANTPNTNSGAASAPASSAVKDCKNKWCCWETSGGTVIDSSSVTGTVVGSLALGPIGAAIGSWLTNGSKTSSTHGCIDAFTADSVTSASYGVTMPFQSTGIAVSEVLLWGGFKIAVYSSYLLDFVIKELMSKPITRDSNWSIPWQDVRTLANMLIVLGFVIVGIATALRIKTWAAGNLLWRLILIALFVNFSGLFCGLIIDASNFTTTGLTPKDSAQPQNGQQTTQSPPLGEYIVYCAQQSSYKILNDNYVKAGTSNFFGMAVLYTAVYLGEAFTFLYLSAILIARYAILIILFILSPLAFAFWVFPASSGFWTEWWKNFLKWAFVGVFGSFVLWLTTFFLPTNGDAFRDQSAQNIVIVFSVVLIFLYVGFKMTADKTGIASMASKAIIGLAGGAVGLATGAIAGGAMGGAKILDKLALGGRGSAAVQKIKSGYGKGLERVGLRKEGSTISSNNKQVEEEASGLSKAYAAAKATGDTGTMERIQKQARVGKGAKGAAAVKVISDAKDLHKAFSDGKGGIDLSTASARLNYAEAAGATGIKEAAAKQNPNLSGDIGKAVQRTNPAQAAEWGANVVTPEVYKHLSQQQIKTIGEKGSPELVAKIKSYQNKNSPDFKKMRDHIQATTASGSAARAQLNRGIIRKRDQITKDANYFEQPDEEENKNSNEATPLVNSWKNPQHQ